MEKKSEYKHAFLIMAHKSDYTFYTLIRMLDDERNDIFIHMDLKNADYRIENTIACAKRSNVYHTKRTNVIWGGYSQINAELLLLELATKKNEYQYYHLMSGEDLPIKSQTYIHDFFDRNNGKEFLRFQSDVFIHKERTSYFYFWEGGPRDGTLKLRNIMNRISVMFQKKIGVCRNRDIDFAKGTSWFSITNELALYVLKRRKWIKNVFLFTFCCDEIFIHTLIKKTKFEKKLFCTSFDNDLRSIMRLIDWERGNPYVFKEEDYNQIIESKMLFARKFDSQVDSKIIAKIFEKFYEK